ncbi:MAG: uracil-DNA glycosylase [Clostridia bacterium]|nr:uracil-DNA glycosylase [Clostridia bacterium]
MDESLKLINYDMERASQRTFPGRRVVFGDGNPYSRLMLIGEAPGGDEEKEGRPFVGRAGRNLMEFLAQIELERKDVYLTNAVKIRPFRLSPKTGKPVNRPPDRSEIDFFAQFLYKEIEAVKPDMIVTLGNVPLQTVLRNRRAQIGDSHGRIICFGENRIFPLYHPAAIIYNRALEKTYSDDIKALKEALESGGIR